MTGLINNFMVYTLVRRLTQSFVDTDAYKLGIIDKDGNNLIPTKDLISREERLAYTKLDRLIFNLRKILMNIPGGRSTLATYAAALWLLREEKSEERELVPDLVEMEIMALSMMLDETVPTNSVSSGNIAGAVPGEDPVVKSKKRKKIIKRYGGIVEAFDRSEPFKVERDTSEAFVASAKIGEDTLGFLALVNGKDHYEVMFTINGKMALTGKGEATKVLSTVIAMLKELIKRHSPKNISFSGEKDKGKGRASLYARMVKRYATQFGYEFSTEDFGNSAMFFLTRK